MAAVQQGMKSLGFPGTLPNPYRERSTVNLHYQLSKYMGTRRTAGAHQGARPMTPDCGPTDVPQDVDIEALRERYRAERDKRLRRDRSAQYLELTGNLADFYEIDPYTRWSSVTRSARTPTSSSSAAGSPGCWPART